MEKPVLFQKIPLSMLVENTWESRSNGATGAASTLKSFLPAYMRPEVRAAFGIYHVAFWVFYIYIYIHIFGLTWGAFYDGLCLISFFF